MINIHAIRFAYLFNIGHAGMFSTALDIYTLVKTLMFPSKDSPFLTAKTMEYFTMVRNLTQSSRAYGWDTNWDSLHENTSCGTLSPETYMHTGSYLSKIINYSLLI